LKTRTIQAYELIAANFREMIRVIGKVGREIGKGVFKKGNSDGIELTGYFNRENILFIYNMTREVTE